MGGFEEYVIFNEDMIYAYHLIKAGYKIAYTSSAEVIHSHNYGNIALFKRYFDLGVSQADYPEIFRNVSSTGEGKKLVSKTIEHLKKKKKKSLIPKLIVNSAFKFMGFRLGLLHEFLPKFLVTRFSSLPEYWIGKDIYENNKKINFHSGYGITEYERTDGRKIHKASEEHGVYRETERKSTLKDEIKVRPKDKMVDRSHGVTANREVAWKSDNEPDIKTEKSDSSDKKEETK